MSNPLEGIAILADRWSNISSIEIAKLGLTNTQAWGVTGSSKVLLDLSTGISFAFWGQKLLDGKSIYLKDTVKKEYEALSKRSHIEGDTSQEVREYQENKIRYHHQKIFSALAEFDFVLYKKVLANDKDPTYEVSFTEKGEIAHKFITQGGQYNA